MQYVQTSTSLPNPFHSTCTVLLFTLVGRVSVIHKPRQRPSPAGLCITHTWPASARRTVYSAKHMNSAAAHARKVLPFSVKNELGLENYGYQCTKFGENR